MNSVKRVVLALGLISLAGASQFTAACSTGGCCSTSSCCSKDCGDGCCYGGYFTNKSFFSDRINAFGSATFLRDGFFRIDAASAREDGFGGALQVVPFGGRTTDHGSKELARWFGYNHKGVCGNAIVFGEDMAVAPLAAYGVLAEGVDLDARHFNIRTAQADGTFKSSVTFSPRQKFFGIGLDWKQVLFFNDDCSRRWWFEVSAPIVHVENDMRMSEAVASDATTTAYTTVKGLDDAPYVASVAEAFSQSNWKYGKILTCATGSNCCSSSSSCATSCSSSCGDMKKTRIADIELKLGYNQSLTDCATLDTYLGAVLPTGNKAKGEYVFEAIVGNGKHWGVMLGAELGFKLTQSDSGSLKWFAAADLRYLFHNEQIRSFDLVGRPWSRYQSMFASKEKLEEAYAFDATHHENDRFMSSGINLMTRCVKVHPRCQFTADTSFAWEGKHLLAEAGYGFYARQAERIDPNWNISPVLGAFSNTMLSAVVNPWRLMSDRVQNSASESLADSQALYERYKIAACDVDWNSASHPAVMNNSLYATLGYKWGDVCYPTMLSIGGACDFAFSNTAMHKWTLFGKLGVSF